MMENAFEKLEFRVSDSTVGEEPHGVSLGENMLLK